MSFNLFSYKWRLTVVVLGLGVFVAAGQNPPGPANPAAVVQSNAVPGTGALPGAATNAVTTNAPSASELAHTNYVHETIERLTSLEMNSDAESLAAILAELKNSDKQIRDAALKAVIQFNDRSAIPARQKLANETADPYEKVDILKAIDYIKLPSFTELMAYKRALKAASHNQTNSASASAGATNLPPAVAQP